jgi:hypothetical protein
MGRQRRDFLSLIDAGAAAENVALAAVDLQVGVCFVRGANDVALRVVLDLPQEVRPDILIAVGHPAPIYLVAAARDSLDGPLIYASLQILEAVSRLVANVTPQDEFLVRAKQSMIKRSTRSWGNEKSLGRGSTIF